MWRLVNEISNRKRKSSNSIKCLSDKDGKKLEDPFCIANCLNTHFSSVGKNMAAKIDNEISSKRLKDPLDYLPKKVKNSLYFSDIDYSEVLSLISKLVLKKACGFDLISNRILKATSYIISPFLAKLFNCCINQGVSQNCGQSNC